MKVLPKTIEQFLKHIPADVRAILVYGPDQGLVAERAQRVAKQVIDDINDPFNSAHLTGDMVAEDPVRFADEANAQSLMGGNRLLRITDAGNAVADPLKNWLKDNPNPSCTVVVAAGDLKPKDALRKICEDLPNAAAIACYVEDERDIGRFLQDFLKENGYAIAPDALQLMIASVKGDRGRIRAEAEKLMLYMGSHKHISVQDIQNSIADAGAQTLDDLITFIFVRNIAGAISAFRKVNEHGGEMMLILRSLQNHIMRLHKTRVAMDTQGLNIETAMAQLSPPVFFKQVDGFKRQVNQFSAPQLRRLLKDVAELEAKTKQTGALPDTLFEHFIVTLAA